MSKKFISLLLAAAMLIGCIACSAAAAGEETVILLSDSGITVDGEAASTSPDDAVYVGGDIIYYQDGTDETYGEGEDHEKHSAEEAAAHTLVTITQPGVYRVSGKLSLGQLFVDLGEEAETDPNAVVTLILDGVDITCTVGPGLFFYSVYECCDKEVDTKGVADTSAAGANVIIADGSVNNVTGSHVARIYKEGTTKKLHKYDGAFYSKMTMNVSGGEVGDGVLNVVADNEGMNSELHLTINGGVINIQSQDDGINTNEDYISVTTINGGTLTVNAGLGAEGDGIDSNGYLTINGGAVWTMACYMGADGGVDADCAITINGGTLSAFGSRNDAAADDSRQPFMELMFASTLPQGSEVKLTDAEGSEVWSAVTQKTCQSITLTSPALELDTVYYLYVDGVKQQYTGNSFGMMMPGGMGGMMPGGGMAPPPGGQMPGGTTPPQPPEGGQMPEGMTPPEGGQPPEGMTPPEGFDPAQMGGRQPGGMGGMTDAAATGEGSVEFVITAQTHSFSGISASAEDSGKTEVTFTVNGGKGVSSVATGEELVLSDITASVAELPLTDIQVTITDVPSEDYAETCLLSDGAEALAAIIPSDDGNYQLTVAVVGSNESYTGASQWQFTVGVLPFTDVDRRMDSYDDIKAIYDAGVMKGTGDNKFSPDGSVTRSQAITVLARLAGAAAEENDAFSDVERNSWYSGYVGWAVANGIVEGDGEGRFYPDAVLTAEQLDLILSRYAGLAGGDYTPDGDTADTVSRSKLAGKLVPFLK